MSEPTLFGFASRSRLTSLKVCIVLAVMVGCFLYGRSTVHPAGISERIVYQDRVVVKDRFLAADTKTKSTKTTVLPNGSKTVEIVEIDSNVTEREHIEETSKIRSETNHISKLPRYSIDIAYRPDFKFPAQGDFQLQVGKRISESPFRMIIGFSADQNFNDKKISLGLGVDVP